MRNNYTISTKLKVIQFASTNTNAKAADKFKIDHSLICRWRRIEGTLLTLPNNTTSRRPGAGRKPTYPDEEALLVDWINESRNNGHQLTQLTIRGKMLELVNLNHQEDNFKASNGWVSRFMARHNFSMRVPTTTNKPHQPQALNEKTLLRIASFKDYYTELTNSKVYSPRCIINMDEPPTWG